MQVLERTRHLQGRQQDGGQVWQAVVDRPYHPEGTAIDGALQCTDECSAWVAGAHGRPGQNTAASPAARLRDLSVGCIRCRGRASTRAYVTACLARCEAYAHKASHERHGSTARGHPTWRLPSEQSSSTIQVSQRRDAPRRVKPLLARTVLDPSAGVVLRMMSGNMSAQTCRYHQLTCYR